MLLDLSDLFSKLNDSNSTLVQFDESIIRQYLLLSFAIAKLYLTSFHFSPQKFFISRWSRENVRVFLSDKVKHLQRHVTFQVMCTYIHCLHFILFAFIGSAFVS